MCDDATQCYDKGTSQTKADESEHESADVWGETNDQSTQSLEDYADSSYEKIATEGVQFVAFCQDVVDPGKDEDHEYKGDYASYSDEEGCLLVEDN